VIGQLLDRRYRIIKVLESGSFGQTYLAADVRRPGMPKCVVKQLIPVADSADASKTAERLFKQEAETLEKLGAHPFIPRLLAYFEENNHLYLVREFIAGNPLTDEIIPGQSLPEEDVALIIEKVLRILEFIHSEDVIHRDVKPENLIRRYEDQEIILIDFGSVKELRHQLAGEANTRTITTGTPVYMPVEQFQGNPQFNSDIYALGTIAVQALTGVSSNNLPKLQNKDGKMCWRDRANVSDEFAAVIDKMVAYSSGSRYQTASDVLEDLEPLILQYFPPIEEEHDEDEPIEQVIDLTSSLPDRRAAWRDRFFTLLPNFQGHPSRISWLLLLLIFGATGAIWFWQRPSESRAEAFYQRGLQKIESGDDSGALSEFNRALKINPQDARAYYKRGNIHYDLGNFDQAIADYGAAIQFNPNYGDAYYNRGLAYLDKGQVKPAIADFNQLLQINPNDDAAFYQRGLAYHEVGDYQSSIQDYTQAILLNPEDPFAYISRGLAYSALGNKQQAIADFTQAIRVDPQEPNAYYSRGRARDNLGDYNSALDDYTQAIKLAPEKPEAYTNRCSVYLNLGEYDQAIEDCSRSIKLDAKAEAAYTNRCVAYYHRKQYDQAIEDCSQVIKLNPESAKALSNRGLAYTAMGKLEAALQDYNAAIKLDKNNAVAYSNRGSVYQNLGEYRQAIEDQTQALRLNPKFANAYFNRAEVRLALNDRAGAIDDLQRAGKTCLDQGYVDCYNNAQARIQELGGQEVSNGQPPQ